MELFSSTRRLLSRLPVPSTAWRTLGPLAAIYVAVVACALLGLHTIAREVDHSDAGRGGEAVKAAFNYHLGRLELVTLNNAVYTEAWRAVGGSRVNVKWAVENWTVAPVNLPGHYGILLLDADNRPIIGTRAGRPMNTSEMTAMAALVLPVLGRLPITGSASVRGLVTTGAEPTFVAAANVVPELDDQTPAALANPKRRLVLIHPLNNAMLATMNETIGADGLKIAAAQNTEYAAAFTADKGKPLVLEWQSREPGQAAKRRAMQTIVPLLLLVTGLSVYAIRAALSASLALQRYAATDQLTQINNRAAFSSELERSLLKGKEPTLGLIDLDGFKAVNDTYGHAMGDDLLKQFAKLLTAAAAPGDFVARLGGDEFAFLCPSEGAADRLVASLRKALSKPHSVGGRLMKIAASVGTAVAPVPGDATGLMAAADAALYVNKRSQRSSVLERLRGSYGSADRAVMPAA